MRILAFSDWRIQPLEMLVELVDSHEPDVILYAGDDLDRFVLAADHVLLKTSNHLIKLTYPDLKPASRENSKVLSRKAKRMLPGMQLLFTNILDELKVPFYFVNGNDDFIMNVDGRWHVRINDGRFTVGARKYQIVEDTEANITLEEDLFLFYKLYREGINLDSATQVDSGIYAPVSLSFGEFDLAKGSEKISVTGIECQYGLHGEIRKAPQRYSDIYLSHLPPLGCLDLSSRFGIDHIGSKKLLAAIKRHTPKLVVCGHSHMWGGNIVEIGETTVVNVSSHDDREATGNYALIDTSDWSIDMKATERSRIHAIPGMRKLKRKCMDLRKAEKLGGLYSGSEADLLESLDYVETFDIDTTLVRERIESLKWKKPKIKRPITLNPYYQAFVDVETGLAQGGVPGKLWLVGIWYDGEITQFAFPSEKKAFLKYIRDNDITSLASWTQYDANALRPVFKKEGIPIYFVDACQRTRNCVIWHTYRLHELYAALFGTDPSYSLIDGYKAGLYADHLIIPNRTCPYCPSPQEAIEQIKQRNKADILLMIDICKELWDG
jgi:Icc-related predicted phosphoesterase